MDPNTSISHKIASPIELCKLFVIIKNFIEYNTFLYFSQQPLRQPNSSRSSLSESPTLYHHNQGFTLTLTAPFVSTVIYF